MYLLMVFLDRVSSGCFCWIFCWIDIRYFIAIVSLIYHVFKLSKAEFLHCVGSEPFKSTILEFFFSFSL